MDLSSGALMRSFMPLMLAAALSLPAVAQEAAAPRFAVFVPDYLTKETGRGRQLFAELDVLAKNLQDKLAAKQAEGQQAQKQLQASGLSAEGQEKLQKQLRDLEFEFKKLQEDSQAEFNKAQQKAYGQFQTEVGPIVEQVAKEQKLQAIFQYTPQTANFIIPIDNDWGMAFTKEVAKRYEAKFPVAAAPAPAAPAAPKPAAPKPAAGAKK
jgi:Skp family chaperone for outer membrane proteins